MRRPDTPDAVRQVLCSSAVTAAVSRARASPASEEEHFADEACARRYIRALEGDLEAAAAGLASTLEWRLRERPKEAICSQCRADLHSHNMRVVGVDDLERPVIYTCFSQALNRFDPEVSMQHLMRTLEDACAIQASRHARGVRPSRSSEPAAPETCVWIIDFHGYSYLHDSNPRSAVLAGRLLGHYPERLGRCLIVDAPRVFSATWSAVRTVINANTASKVAFVSTGDGTFESDAASWATGPLKSWLLAEMADNRLPGHQNGEKEYWRAPAAGDREAHDPRGAADFVACSDFALTLTARMALETAPTGEESEVCSPGSAPSTSARREAALTQQMAADYGPILRLFLVFVVAAVLLSQMHLPLAARGAFALVWVVAECFWYAPKAAAQPEPRKAAPAAGAPARARRLPPGKSPLVGGEATGRGAVRAPEVAREPRALWCCGVCAGPRRSP